MTDRQLDDIITLICSYGETIEDLERIKGNIDILIENMKEDMECEDYE